MSKFTEYLENSTPIKKNKMDEANQINLDLNDIVESDLALIKSKIEKLIKKIQKERADVMMPSAIELNKKLIKLKKIKELLK